MTTPRTLTDLSEVAPEMHDWYVPAEGGGFRLDPVLEKDIDQYDADKAARQAAHEEAMAERDAEIARLQAHLHTVLVRREVNAALNKAGVLPAHVPLVSALLRERMRFVVEVDHDADTGPNPPPYSVSVADAYGEVGVEFAVNTWLATEEADAFRPAPKATDGPLMARLRELRARMQ